MISDFFEQIDQTMNQMVDEVDETVTQMFTPQGFMSGQNSSPQDIIFTFENMVLDSSHSMTQIDMPQFDFM
jgi:hypothetical protein